MQVKETCESGSREWSRWCRQQWRQHSALVGPGGDDDVGGFDRTLGCLGHEAGSRAAQPRHLDAAADRGGDEPGVGGEKLVQGDQVGHGAHVRSDGQISNVARRKATGG